MVFLWIAIGLLAVAALLGVTLYIIAEKTFERVVGRPQDKGAIKDAKSLSNRTIEYTEYVIDRMKWLSEQRLERVSINSFDGTRLQGYLYMSEKPTERFVLCVHGYTSFGFRGFAPLAKFYHDFGVNMLILDNRAHGESQGKYAGMGVLERKDVLCWLDYLLKTFGDKLEIYLHGVSMGGATVLMASGLELPPQVKGIVADCAFSNFYDEMNHTIKATSGINGTPIVWMVDRVCRRKAGYSFRSVDASEEVKKAKVPILFLHGDSDYFVPHTFSQKAYQNCPTRKDYILVEGAGHCMAYYMKPREIENRIVDLITNGLDDSNKN